jgi:hypothetical protein
MEDHRTIGIDLFVEEGGKMINEISERNNQY